MEKKLKIATIKVSNRHRKSYGDLQGLAYSIKKVGLLQAIGVTKTGNRLVFGERRLKAIEMNGEKSIDCRILDIKNILEAEHAENEFRESLSLTEKHALAKELGAEEAEKERRGRPKKGGQLAHLLVKGKTREHVATKAGFNSEREMRRVNAVIDKGTPELVEAMDKGDITVHAAAEVAKKPKKQQKDLLDKHRGKDGKIRPKGLQKSQAVLFHDRMQETLERIWGVEKQFGGVKEMMESPLWATSTPAEKRQCIQTVVSLSQELVALAKEMSSYGRKHLTNKR